MFVLDILTGHTNYVVQKHFQTEVMRIGWKLYFFRL
jgi:hypothetical protein